MSEAESLAGRLDEEAHDLEVRAWSSTSQDAAISSGLAREAAALIRQQAAEVERLTSLLNTPEIEDFVRAVMLEAPHQRERWGADHDADKSPLDWFWLVGFLAQKATDAAIRSDADKAKHHTISTAAALANWHAALSPLQSDQGEGDNHSSLRPTGFAPGGEVDASRQVGEG